MSVIDDPEIRAHAVALLAAALDGNEDVLMVALEPVAPATRSDPIFQAVLGIVSAMVRLSEQWQIPAAAVLATWATGREIT